MIEGVLYVETAEGELDEAFMECTVKQQIHRKDQRTAASGNCVIVQGPEDNIYAEYRCDGQVGACKGELRLTSGTGRFADISGSGKLIMRSPLRHLTTELTDAESIHVDNGILLLPELQFEIKGGTRR